jgi:glycosyltransferase involved in cell wall biosynthesis
MAVVSRVAVVSFRLGLTDGVSIVAESWGRALEAIGFDVVTVAGEGPVDRTIPGLALSATKPPRPDEVHDALADADLVVVENALTIPLALPASLVLAEALRGRPVILHHHDPPWQRERFAHVTDLPVDDPAWRHVTINRLTELQFAERGLRATTIYNGFALPQRPGNRAAVRASLGVGENEVLVAHPVRAIQRKNIPAAIALTEQLGATYWLLGGPEEDYDATLDSLVRSARCRVVQQPWAHGPDLYAAPDLVVFPSHWEGFGNPPIEAALHGRPAAVGDYPVARELRELGFEWLDPADANAVRAFLREPDLALLERNRTTAERHFSLDALRDALAALLDEAGWAP